MLNKEIERKFIINRIPSNLEAFEKKYVSQNYLSITGEEEIRLRKENENGKLSFDVTYKNGSGLTRDEFKFNIGEDLFDDLSKNIKEKPIEKFRQFFLLEEHQVMVDEYIKPGFDLLIAEVEFESEEEAKDFVVPEWFGEEVTYNSDYKNRNLWRKIQ